MREIGIKIAIPAARNVEADFTLLIANGSPAAMLKVKATTAALLSGMICEPPKSPKEFQELPPGRHGRSQSNG